MSQGRKTKALQMGRAALLGLLNSPSAPDSFKIAGEAIADLLHAGEKDEGAPAPAEDFPVGHLAAEEAAILDSVISKIGQAVEKAVRKAVHDEFMAHALSLAVPGEAAREEAAEKDPVRPTD